MKELELVTRRHTPRFCPVCFSVLDSTSALTGDRLPVPGDFSICINCRSILRVGAGFVFEKSSLMEVPEDSRMEFVRALRLMEENPPPPRKKVNNLWEQ